MGDRALHAVRHERELRKTETRYLRRALKLQAKEYQRRLKVLNNENDRIREIQSGSVTAEKFDDYQKAQETALALALQRQDDRIKTLEDWKARATVLFVVLVPLAGVIGAAIMRALLGG